MVHHARKSLKIAGELGDKERTFRGQGWKSDLSDVLKDVIVNIQPLNEAQMFKLKLKLQS